MTKISELKAAAEVISNYCDELWETMPKNADGIYENAPCEECAFYDNCMRRLPLEWECPNCHTKHNRDTNASINILKKGCQ